ncbi:hypothetical protein SAY87_015307 [Trapa incisa]|uniref:Uncharacterized protein n=1 Tax=Trapa incisa TaxID=236973 RepID=A0AAN7GLG7_9MYRT|nr:hypothetical protein SAY87_015307 [Trapa incisa]
MPRHLEEINSDLHFSRFLFTFILMGRCKRKVITCRVGPNALAMVLRFPVGALCCWLARQVSPDRHHPGYPNHINTSYDRSLRVT